jgi:N-sulfoglucosamine sulfohydrolase
MTDQPNVLLITSEDNGPEIGCYGDSNASTPHLDDLAASGTRFDNAYVTQAVCSPGRASILTGLYPHENGQIGLTTRNYRMFDGIETLPTVLHDAGYRTGRFGKLHVGPESAFAFDRESDPWGFGSRDVATRAENVGEFVTAGEEPFFAMANYRESDLPWIDGDHGIPEEPLTGEDVEVPQAVGVDTPRLREHAAGYYNCLSRLDAGIGMLLETLERTGHARNTVVIYVADHGSQFSRGKCTSYELGVRTPLIVRWPGVTAPGTVRPELVSQIDVLPTVLDAAGVPTPASVTGRSLEPLLGGADVSDWRQYLFTEWNVTWGPDESLCYPQRTVRDNRYKLIYNMLAGEENPVERYYTEGDAIDVGTDPSEIENAPAVVRRAYERWRHPPEIELYDLRTDPYEFHDLSDDPAYADVRDRLFQRLRRWQAETNDRLADAELLDRFVEEHTAAPDAESLLDYLEYLNPR